VKDLLEPILEVGLALRTENKERFWQMWLRDELYSDDSDDDGFGTRLMTNKAFEDGLNCG
jgi:hypothetical protein